MKRFPAAVNSAKWFLIIALMFIGAVPALANDAKAKETKVYSLSLTVDRIVDGAIDKCEKKVEAAKAAPGPKDEAYFNGIDAALKNLERTKANARRVYGRLNKLKDAVTLHDEDIKGLRDDIARLDGVTKAHGDEIVKILGRVNAVEVKVGEIEQVRLPAVEQQAARAEAKADAALASGADIEAMLGVYTGFVTKGESGAVAGLCARDKGTGIGGCASVLAGVSNVFGREEDETHPTTIMVKAGPSIVVGDSASPVVLNVNGAFGAGSKHSISSDSGAFGGLTVGMDLRFGRFTSVPLTLGGEVGMLWGRIEGPVATFNIGIDLAAARKVTHSQSAQQQAFIPAYPPTMTPAR